MRVNAESTSLVIAGAWNPMVLQPPWVLARIPGMANSPNYPVTTQLGLGIVDDPPRFTFNDYLRYQVRKAALILSPQRRDAENFGVVQATAIALLRDLPHTPVSGVGFNFEFHAENADRSLAQLAASQADVVDALDDTFVVLNNTIRTSVSSGGMLLNIQKEYQGGQLVLKFNFHWGVASAVAAITAIEGRGFWSAHENAVEIATSIFGEELVDE